MRCFVTGANGFVGAYVLARLLEDGHEVSALVRQTSDLSRIRHLSSRLDFVTGDLADPPSYKEGLVAAAPEVVIHLAWSGVTGSRRNDDDQVLGNVRASLDLFQIVRDAGCGVWVGLGSQADYGAHETILTEATPTTPDTAYGVAKLSVGLLTGKLAELAGMRHVWLRLLSTYGPMDDERHMITMVIRRLLRGERPQLTFGEQLWDYLYVEDAADAICRVAVDPRVCGIYNLCSGEGHTVRSVVERIGDLIDPALPLGFGEVAYRPDQVMHLLGSADKLRAATGWEPRISLDEGLRRTVDWYRGDRE